MNVEGISTGHLSEVRKYTHSVLVGKPAGNGQLVKLRLVTQSLQRRMVEWSVYNELHRT